MKNAALSGKPYAGNLHVRIEEGKVVSEKPRRGSLLHKSRLLVASAALAIFAQPCGVFADAESSSAIAVTNDVAFFPKSKMLLRFWVLKTRGSSGEAKTNGEVQLSEFDLMKDGAKVAWPEGTTVWSAKVSSESESPAKVIDGKTDTKYYTGSWDAANPSHALYFTLPESVTFDSYRYATGNDSAPRDPISFRLEVGEVAGGTTNWTVVGKQEDAEIRTSRSAYTQTFALDVLLPKIVIPEVPVSTANPVASILRFWILKTRGSDGSGATHGEIQFSEFDLMKDGAKVPWPAGTTVWSAAAYAEGNQTPQKLIDGDVGTKWYYGYYGRHEDWDSTNPDHALYFTLPEPVTFDSYRYATGNDTPARDPISFKLEVGEIVGGSTNWTLVGKQEGVGITTSRSAYTPVFPVCCLEGKEISVSAGARLAVRCPTEEAQRAGVDTLALQDLSGKGLVVVQDAPEFLLKGASTFAGLLQVTNGVSLVASSAVLPPLGGAEATTVVRNNGMAGVLGVASGLTRQFGAYRDGVSTLGLSVSNGAEMRFVASPSNVAARAAYTGATTVEAGSTLSITGPDVPAARYFRFTPIVNRRTDEATNKCCAVGDIRLMRDGAELPWPLGTTASSDNCLVPSALNALDGSTLTECVWNIKEEPFGFAPLVIETPTAVRFDGYCWYTGANVTHGTDNWDPRAWTFEYSQDGESWTLVDAKTRFQGCRAVPRGSLGHCCRLDIGNAGHQAVRARFIRFMPLANRGITEMQLSDIRLRRNGVEITWPAETIATSNGNAAGNEDADKLIDNDTGTKCYWDLTAKSIVPVLITMPEAIEFSGYSWYTAGDVSNRDPVDWTFEYSLDGETWVMMDAPQGVSVPTKRNALAYTYDHGGPDLEPVLSDAISDDSPVALAGALVVSCADETIGSLSGDGLVTFCGRGSRLGVKTTAAATFAGTLTGEGTFIKRGAGVQTLSGEVSLVGTLVVEEGVLDLADISLTGVTNIVLKGGQLTGTASVGGDLAISCEDGICEAKLTVAGALTLDGRLVVSMPDGVLCNLSAATLVITPGTEIVIDATAVTAQPEIWTRLCSADAVSGTVDPASVNFLTTQASERFFAGATVVTQHGLEFGLWAHVKCGLVIIFR